MCRISGPARTIVVIGAPRDFSFAGLSVHDRLPACGPLRKGTWLRGDARKTVGKMVLRGAGPLRQRAVRGRRDGRLFDLGPLRAPPASWQNQTKTDIKRKPRHILASCDVIRIITQVCARGTVHVHRSHTSGDAWSPTRLVCGGVGRCADSALGLDLRYRDGNSLGEIAQLLQRSQTAVGAMRCRAGVLVRSAGQTALTRPSPVKHHSRSKCVLRRPRTSRGAPLVERIPGLGLDDVRATFCQGAM